MIEAIDAFPNNVLWLGFFFDWAKFGNLQFHPQPDSLIFIKLLLSSLLFFDTLVFIKCDADVGIIQNDMTQKENNYKEYLNGRICIH
jgi:hypothetical protein